MKSWRFPLISASSFSDHLLGAGGGGGGGGGGGWVLHLDQYHIGDGAGVVPTPAAALDIVEY